MEGDDSDRWKNYKWKRYKEWVKQGYKPVRPKVREQWCTEMIQQGGKRIEGSSAIKIKYTEEGGTIVSGAAVRGRWAYSKESG